jgi:YbbR-like protein
MIAILKRLVLKDMWLKLFSLGVAILIWSTISIAIQKDVAPSSLIFGMGRDTFYDVPVEVQISATDTRNFRVEPKTVKVTVEGDPELLSTVQSKDIRATVDLRGSTELGEVTKRIEVSTPAGLKGVTVVPPEVRIIFTKSQ